MHQKQNFSNLKEIRNVYYMPETKTVISTKEGKKEVYIQLKPKRIKDLKDAEIEKILYNIGKGVLRDSHNYSIKELEQYLLLEVQAREEFGRYLVTYFLQQVVDKPSCGKGMKEAYQTLQLPVNPVLFHKKARTTSFDTRKIKDKPFKEQRVTVV